MIVTMPIVQQVLAMGHHRKSFAVRSLCAVLSLGIAVSIYKPFFLMPHLVDNVPVSEPCLFIYLHAKQYTQQEAQLSAENARI